MLYGNVIFIKKSGGDGSKFPVTSTNVCIGRSDDCIIRIQNPLISPKHCQLTIDSDGQARIKNLSSTNPTVLNDKQLGNSNHVLRQGDILKLGERFARWEYLPSSKYYSTAQSSGSLVTVVAHRSRNSEETSVETSHLSSDSAKKQNKRFTGLGRGSLGRSLRVTPGSAKSVSSRKQLVLRHSLQLKKFGLSPRVKLRSSLLESSSPGTSNLGTVNTTPIRKSQKWEVKSVSPPDKVKPPFKNGMNRKSTPIKMPMSQLSGENIIKSGLKNVSKAPNLLTIAELPLTNVQKILSERTTFEDVPENNLSISPKSPCKNSKTPNKMKINSQKKSSSKSAQKKSLSRALKDLQSSFSIEENTEISNSSKKLSPSERYKMRNLVMRKSVLQKEIVNSGQSSPMDVTFEKLPDISVGKRKSSVLIASGMSSEGVSADVEADKIISPKTAKSSPVISDRGKCPSDVKTSPVSSPGKVEGPSRGKKSIPSGVLDTPVGKENVKDTPRKNGALSSKKLRVASTKKDSQHRGIERKLSAIASAERAAKKLKTIAPTKPDKNKKAALLVLGKASGKLKVSQNPNMVIKKRIVKRTIKQFALNRKRSGTAKLNRAKNSANILHEDVEKSLNLSPKTLATSTKRHSTPIGKTPVHLPKGSSSRKSVIIGEVMKPEICTPVLRNRKSISSISSVSGSDSMEVLHGSVPSKYSEKKSVSFSSTTSSIEYKSPNLCFDVKDPISKRLGARCSDSSPEMTELSPFALGLTPKRMDDNFVAQRQKGRRSLCLTTPKNNSPVGIMKSASTSKINRKLVAYSDKDSNDTSYFNLTSDAIFDLNEVQSPNVTIDLFVSPLSHKNTPRLRNRSTISKSSQDVMSREEGEKYTSPKHSAESKSDQNMANDENSTKKKKSPGMLILVSGKKNSRPQKSPKNDLTDVRGVRRLFDRMKQRKSPKNDLTDVRGVRRLMESAERRRSPKNDLTDVRGVRRLMESAGRRRSPKNDLTDVRGVRRLMESAGRRRSPKNDLTDVRGVRRLMESAGRRKSPKNDLTDVRGVRRLFDRMKQRTSPRNDLTDVTGVKQLLSVKSPKNDLSNVSGLDTFFKSPSNISQSPRTLRNPASENDERNNLSGVSQVISMDKINDKSVDLSREAESFLSSEKDKTPKKRTRNATATIPAFSSEGPVLRRATKATSKIVDESDMVKTRRKANSSSEVPVGQNLKVVRRGRKIDTDDEVEKTVPKRTRTGLEREVKVIEKIKEPKKNLIAEEVIIGRRTRASSKMAARNEAAKRPATPSKSPTPVKRTRKGPAAREKVGESSNKTAKQVLTTPESKSRPTRSTRKSTAKESLNIRKIIRTKETQAVAEVPEVPDSSRSLRQRAETKTKTVKETRVSSIVTRQRKAKTASPAKKTVSKSSPVKTRRKAK